MRWLAGRSAPPSLYDLPRQLANKRGLHEICRRFGVPTPATSRVNTGDDLEATLADLALPVVVKQTDPWSRLTRPVVTGSTVVRTAEDVRRLRTAFDRWPGGSDVVVQEYLPDDDAEDWFVHSHGTLGHRETSSLRHRRRGVPGPPDPRRWTWLRVDGS